MKELEALHKKKFRYVVADAGYDGEENFAWLMGNNYISCIKPATHERSKTRKWKQDISRAENMQYCQETDTFICTNGKPLTFQYERKKKTKSGFVCTSKVYAATCCDGCPTLRSTPNIYIFQLDTMNFLRKTWKYLVLRMVPVYVLIDQFKLKVYLGY